MITLLLVAGCSAQIAADKFNSYIGYSEENYLPYMKYDEIPNDKYGLTDQVYFSLDGRV